MNAPPVNALLSVELHLPHQPADIQLGFRVAPGQIFALVAPSDPSRTAALEALAGLRAIKRGRITVGPTVLFDSTTGVNLPPHRRRLAWVDGHTALPAHLTVGQQLRLGASLAAAARTATTPAHLRPEAVAEALGLTPVLGLRTEHCSASQKLRTALARALLSQPRALLLHHPLDRVPELERALLVDLLADVRLRHRLPMVLVCQRMTDVMRLADDMLVLHEGRVAAAGPVCQVLSDVSLSTFLEGEQAGSLLDAEVRRHDLEWLLSEVDVGGQWVTVPALLQEEGRRVRLKIRARDVHVHREPREDGGSSNQLRGRIAQVMLAGQHGTYGAVSVHLAGLRPGPGGGPPDAHGAPDRHALRTQGATLWSLMTRRTIEQLGLAPGQDCHVSFKAMAVTVLPRN